MEYKDMAGKGLVVIVLLLGLMASFSCAAFQFTSLCIVRDNTRVDCMHYKTLALVLGEARFLGLLKRLEQQLKQNRQATDVIYQCSSNGYVGGLASTTDSVDAVQMFTMSVRCGASVASDLGLGSSDLGSMAKGARPHVLSSALNLDSKYSACKSNTAGSTLMLGPIPTSMGELLWEIITHLGSDGPTEQSRARDAEEKRQKDNAQAYEKLLNRQYLERLRKELEEEEKKKKEEEEQKKKQAQKPSTDSSNDTGGGASSSSGLGDHVETPPPCPRCAIANCIDEACAPTCQEEKEAWIRFKLQCDQSNWTSYSCLTFVKRGKGCPDTARIFPTPDGDHKCGAKMTEQEMAKVRKEICERRQGVMTSDPGLARCSTVSRTFPTLPPGHMCNDPRALWLDESCLNFGGLPTGTKVGPRRVQPPLPTQEKGALSTQYMNHIDLYFGTEPTAIKRP